jgi:hypothetical protein
LIQKAIRYRPPLCKTITNNFTMSADLQSCVSWSSQEVYGLREKICAEKLQIQHDKKLWAYEQVCFNESVHSLRRKITHILQKKLSLQARKRDLQNSLHLVLEEWGVADSFLRLHQRTVFCACVLYIAIV